MLMLTRRIGESIRIGDDFEVALLGDQARIGIAAAPMFAVNPQEVQDQIQRGKGDPEKNRHLEQMPPLAAVELGTRYGRFTRR